MPTILVKYGWRLYFYSNEGNEPIHIHCRKGDMECKFWLDRENFDISEAYSYKLTVGERRNIRKIILENFGYIEDRWDLWQGELKQ